MGGEKKFSKALKRVTTSLILDELSGFARELTERFKLIFTILLWMYNLLPESSGLEVLVIENIKSLRITIESVNE